MVKWSASTLDRVRSPAEGLVILAYHRVGRRSGIEVDLPLPLFRRQMEVLAASYRVVTLDAAVVALQGGEPLSPGAVVITFDDGTSDFADLAVPVLRELSLPATLYLATAYVEAGRSFPNGGLPLSWDGARDVLSTGLVTIGSHSDSHPRFDRVDQKTVATELARSVQLIEDRLEIAPQHFAYPYGIRAGGASELEVRRRFRSAAIGGTRPNRPANTDVHRLSRSPVQVSDGIDYFLRKVEGGMWLEDTARQLWNRSHPVVNPRLWSGPLGNVVSAGGRGARTRALARVGRARLESNSGER